MEKKIVLLCDYGLDDAVATAFVLQKKKKNESIDIIPIGGNSAVEVSYRNAHTLLANYDGDKNGIRIVDSRAVSQPYVEHPTIHGKDGLGDLFTPQKSDVEQITLEQFLSETGEFILVSLGPCTIETFCSSATSATLSAVLTMPPGLTYPMPDAKKRLVSETARPVLVSPKSTPRMRPFVSLRSKIVTSCMAVPSYAWGAERTSPTAILRPLIKSDAAILFLPSGRTERILIEPHPQATSILPPARDRTVPQGARVPSLFATSVAHTLSILPSGV